MTEHLESEEDLFRDPEFQTPPTSPYRTLSLTPSANSSPKSNPSDPESRKRRSLGFILPVKMSGKEIAGRSGSPASDDETTGGLGLAGYSRAKGDPSLTFQRAKSDGKVVKIDVWNQVTNLVKDSAALSKVYTLSSMDGTYSLREFVNHIEFQGFDRAFYIRYAMGKMSPFDFIRFALMGAIRGSNFEKITNSCENMPTTLITVYKTLGFVKTPRKKDDLTILRCTASIPQWCAYHIHLLEISKKIVSCDCPAFLQFPAAASLPMSKELRLQHIRFCIEFSSVLPNGNFNLNIYLTAYKNLIPLDEIPVLVSSQLGISSMKEASVLSIEEITSTVNTMVAVRKS